MRKLAVISTVVSMCVLMAFASTASAKHGFQRLANQECKAERIDDPAEYKARYGTGKKALRRCVRQEIANARADCREERFEEPAEFAREYGGTGKKAMRLCIRDELR